VKALRSPYLTMGLFLLTALAFASQPAAHQSGGSGLLIPLLLLATLATSLACAQAFRARPWLAALFALLLVGLFSIGQAYAHTALGVMLHEPMPWWNEDVFWTIVIVCGPLIALTPILTFVLARLLSRPTA
jgi:hypothetical protein